MSLSGRHDQADDLVQETVMKAWSKQADFTLGTNMNAWLFTILRNLYYSRCASAGREVQDVDGVFTARLGVAPSHDGRMDLADFRRALEACRPTSARRSPDRRGGVLLRGGGAICGCATGTVKSRVSRARSRLQGVLACRRSDYGPDPATSGPCVSRAFAR
jgi:RNA polymerase sigma-70 factor (ECF subfamily)